MFHWIVFHMCKVSPLVFANHFVLNHYFQAGMHTAYYSGLTGSTMKQSSATAMHSSGRRLVGKSAYLAFLLSFLVLSCNCHKVWYDDTNFACLSVGESQNISMPYAGPKAAVHNTHNRHLRFCLVLTCNFVAKWAGKCIEKSPRPYYCKAGCCCPRVAHGASQNDCFFC